jgi:hypothetical protein
MGKKSPIRQADMMRRAHWKLILRRMQRWTFRNDMTRLSRSTVRNDFLLSRLHVVQLLLDKRKDIRYSRRTLLLGQILCISINPSPRSRHISWALSGSKSEHVSRGGWRTELVLSYMDLIGSLAPPQPAPAKVSALRPRWRNRSGRLHQGSAWPQHMRPGSSQWAITLRPVLDYAANCCMMVWREGWIRGKLVRSRSLSIPNFRKE